MCVNNQIRWTEEFLWYNVTMNSSKQMYKVGSHSVTDLWLQHVLLWGIGHSVIVYWSQCFSSARYRVLIITIQHTIIVFWLNVIYLTSSKMRVWYIKSSSLVINHNHDHCHKTNNYWNKSTVPYSRMSVFKSWSLTVCDYCLVWSRLRKEVDKKEHKPWEKAPMNHNPTKGIV